MTGQVPAQAVRRAALTGFRYLPRPLRRVAVRLGTPQFTVGCVLVLTDDAQRVLLLRQRHYGAELTLPGGLLRRGEAAVAGITREVAEEVGVVLDVAAPATAAVDPLARRVDLVFTARLDGDPEALRPDRDEAVEVCWLAVPPPPVPAPALTPATQAVLWQVSRAGGGVPGTARTAGAPA